MYVRDYLTRQELVVFAWKVLIVAIAVIVILLVSATARAQETGTVLQDSSTQTVDSGTQTSPVEVNEIKIPELNLLKIQNLNFRFQLLVNQRDQIDQELRKIQVEVFTELANVRKSLDADSDTWNVDLVKGVFVRKPVVEEKKE